MSKVQLKRNNTGGLSENNAKESPHQKMTIFPQVLDVLLIHLFSINALVSHIRYQFKIYI